MTEAQLQHSILKFLGNYSNVVVWRVNSLQAFGKGRAVRSAPKGHADLAGIFLIGSVGCAVYIEVKSARGKLTKEQCAFGAMVAQMGGCFIIARSIEDVVSGLNHYEASVNKLFK